MDLLVHQHSLTQLKRRIRFLRLLSLLLVLAVLIQSAAVMKFEQDSERIVIVPPEINGEFWLEENRVSQRYFLEWGYYLVSLILNVTPDSIGYQTEVLLRHVAPLSRFSFAERLEIASENMLRERLSTFFAVNDVYVEQKSGRIAFVGTLSSYVEGRKTSEQESAYMAIFQVKNGGLQLLEFIETIPANPFSPKKSA